MAGLSGGIYLNSELKHSSQQEKGPAPVKAEGGQQDRRILTVPGWQWKLMSSRTWATRTAKDRLAWMW